MAMSLRFNNMGLGSIRSVLLVLVAGFVGLTNGLVYTQAANGKVLEGSNTRLDQGSTCGSVLRKANLVGPVENTESGQENFGLYRGKTVDFSLVRKKTAGPQSNFLLSPPEDLTTPPPPPQLSHFPFSCLPHLFVSARTIPLPEPYSIPFDYSQLFYFLFCSIELFLSISHLLVHLGIKNSRYRFITKQKIYFSVDASLTTLNLLVFWENYYFMRFFMVLAIILHAYYVADLIFTNGKSEIFKWSSVDLAKDRFGINNIKENIETLIDDTCHFTGFLSAFLEISCLFKVLAIGLSLGVLWLLVLNAKFFFTKKHMMPCWLQNLIPEDSR